MLSALPRAAVLALLLLSPFLAVGQSCALCYTQAASSGSRMIRALRSGILILVVPPTLMSVGVIFVAYAKRNQFRSTDPEGSDCLTDVDDDAPRHANNYSEPGFDDSRHSP
jgi:hypothetical protein